MIDPAYLITGILMFFGILGAHKFCELIEEFHRRGMERVRGLK